MVSFGDVVLREEHVNVVARVSALLGEGYEFVGYKGYMRGVQLNWRRGNLSVMWREEFGEDVEVYDVGGSGHAEIKTFEELKYMR